MANSAFATVMMGLMPVLCSEGSWRNHAHKVFATKRANSFQTMQQLSRRPWQRRYCATVAWGVLVLLGSANTSVQAQPTSPVEQHNKHLIQQAFAGWA
jgi:hypothetical protein